LSIYQANKQEDIRPTRITKDTVYQSRESNNRENKSPRITPCSKKDRDKRSISKQSRP
jgi:hypothetical protein